MPLFTVKGIEALKPKEKIYQVREGKGFGIRVFPSGEKTWFFAYKFHGIQRTMTLGGYPDKSLKEARSDFEKERKNLANGIDPLGAKQAEKEEPTVKEAVEEFLKSPTKRTKKPRAGRTSNEYQRSLGKDVLPRIGRFKLKDITEDHITLILERIVDRGSPNQALQVYKASRALFAWACPKYKIRPNPFDLVEKPAADNKRNRFLSEAEIKALWSELDHVSMSDAIQTALRLILVTGQRPGEVIGLHSGEISGEWWTIPSERAKNKKEHRVFLTTLAREIIGTFEGFRFPSPKATKVSHIEVNALAHAVRRCSLWGQPNGSKKDILKEKPLLSIDAAWTPHDLRRTCASHLGKIGYSDEVIGRILNHTRQGVTSRYNRHEYDAESQTALEAWSRKLESIVTGQQQSNVIPMVRNR